MPKLEKLQVQAFKTAKRKGKPESSAIFYFLLNPENIGSRHENRFSSIKGINTSGRKAAYAFSQSDELSIELMLDRTLSRENLPGNFLETKESVKQTIDRYLKYCFYMDGNIHEPRFLMVIWGNMEFECRLKSVDVTYSVFNDDGEPMRAKLSNVFVADMPTSKRIRMENKKSPDITHYRVVLAGDTLSSLTKEIYGDASHYLMVAEENKLDHFRYLKPGTELYFPPLDKEL
jgi:nucleoid-associated protein YgaU